MHELLARMIGATPSHVLTLKDRLIDWLIVANWPPSARLSNSKMETRSAFHNSIQQKFRFEISEIPRAQWNGTFRLHSPDPNRIQKSGTGDNNVVK